MKFAAQWERPFKPKYFIISLPSEGVNQKQQHPESKAEFAQTLPQEIVAWCRGVSVPGFAGSEGWRTVWRWETAAATFLVALVKGVCIPFRKPSSKFSPWMSLKPRWIFSAHRVSLGTLFLMDDFTLPENRPQGLDVTESSLYSSLPSPNFKNGIFVIALDSRTPQLVI